MSRITSCAIGALLALSLFGAGAALAKDGDHDGDDNGATSTCHFRSDDGRIKHIVEIQFDNVHFRRDNPNVPSDLEQIPSLLNFIEGNGTMLGNHHTPLISHTSVDILTTLSGVYGEHMGIPIGNTILFYNADGSVSFHSAFNYWTDMLEPATATTPAVPHQVDQRGKIAPAPWVPFTRAGCDVGAFSVANIEFENVSGDITTAFGAGSPEDIRQKTVNALSTRLPTNLPTNTPDPAVNAANAATNAANAATNAANQAQKDKLTADFEGIAIHCAKTSKVCGGKGTADLLPDEPGGYTGFNALFGNINVAPAINHGNGFVLDLDGNHVGDGTNDGFPGFDPSPSQTLGYLAQMLEAGVPVVYGYIEDAHDNHDFPADPDGAFGPGEAGYVAQLKTYDTAFAEFFARLKKDGITKDNTLFIITADENDHFAGGPPTPTSCDGVTTPCTYPVKGEVDLQLSDVFFTEAGLANRFDADFDDAPGIWIDHNQGGQTDPLTRSFETAAGKLVAVDPAAGGVTNNVAQRLADQAEQSFLHMITSDPRRTPNFILFGNPDYFMLTSAPKTCSPLAACSSENRDFAWNHGDFQEEIVHTWLGLVGPGVKHLGVKNDLFTDHTDVRPTALSLAGLKDDYTHDGRVVFEVLNDDALPDSLNDHEDTLHRLAVAFKDINAPVGKLGLKTLEIATAGAAGSDTANNAARERIEDLTARRNAIAGKMLDMLEDAAFNGQAIDPEDANELIEQAHDLLESAGVADDHDDHHGDDDE